MFLKTIRVRMSLMPEKMRAILESGTSPIIKVQFLEFSSWDTLRTSISVHYLPTKLRQNSSTSLTTVSEEFKNKPVSNVFSLLTMLIFTNKFGKKTFKARKILWTLETKNRKSVSMGSKPAVQSTCKTSFN
jgi:hypothetical protein